MFKLNEKVYNDVFIMSKCCVVQVTRALRVCPCPPALRRGRVAASPALNCACWSSQRFWSILRTRRPYVFHTFSASSDQTCSYIILTSSRAGQQTSVCAHRSVQPHVQRPVLRGRRRQANLRQVPGEERRSEGAV